MSGDQEFVILVDESDREIGQCEKLEAHRRGLRHRAFSVIVKDREGRILVQQRAAGKYHSPNLWANACCGHPRAGEEVGAAARRRLGEELGIDCDLVWKRHHSYCQPVGDELTENEFVHVFFGTFAGEMALNEDEVAAIRWLALEDLLADVEQGPDRHAVWWRNYLEHFGGEISQWRDNGQSGRSR
jgi:isopentenyl-diphosphate delta-isomerase